jgi:Tfp pilus assembly protein PilZ
MGVVIEHGALLIDALTVNLGLGGAYIEIRPPLRCGERVTVLIQLPELPRPSRLSCVVRWSDSSGIGLQFLQMGARETYGVSVLVAMALQRQARTEPIQEPAETSRYGAAPFVLRRTVPP